MSGPLRRLRRGIVALAVPVLLLAGLGSPHTASADPRELVTAMDPDRNSQALTAWGWHTHVSPSTVSAFVGTGYRIIDLEVTSATPTFTVSYVRNTGAYSRGWWWYYNKTATEVSNLLTANNARLIDIEPYTTRSGTRYAVVMVANTGVAQKAWGWHANVSLATISNYARTNGMRVIDVDRMPGQSAFTAIYIRNQGVDARGWWHYYNVTPAQIASLLNTNRARLIDFERLTNGNYDVVMQRRGGEYWWWLHGATAQQISDAANQFGARIYKIKSYVVNSVRRFDALFINNVNAETTRIRQLVANQMTGKWGFYLKRVGSGDLVGIGQDIVFEPASMIKIVHAVTAMRDMQNTSVGPFTKVTWYAHPSYPARYPTDPGYREGPTHHADVCAYNADTGALLTSRTYSDYLGPVVVKQAMQQSDNRTTDALTRRYGFSGLEQTIDLAGMTSSEVNHRIGCPGTSSPQPVAHNELTLRDAGRIYEKVQNGTLLNATYRNLLHNYMNGGPISSNGALANMIRAEAAAAGLTEAETDDFVSRVLTRSKGGSYGYCPNFDGSGTCNPPTLESRTVGGVIWLPVKTSSGFIAPRTYVYGRYFDTQFDCTFAQTRNGSCTAFENNADGIGVIAVEMFRAEVRKAIATW